jgi:hypothetical protein
MSKRYVFVGLFPRPYSKMVISIPFFNLTGRFFVADIFVAIDDYTGKLFQASRYKYKKRQTSYHSPNHYYAERTKNDELFIYTKKRLRKPDVSECFLSLGNTLAVCWFI